MALQMPLLLHRMDVAAGVSQVRAACIPAMPPPTTVTNRFILFL